MGSNMAEQHPVAFQWVVEAKERGAEVFHVDPRYTRTSALADLHVPLRPGSDIVFLGAVVNHILSTGSEFREYVREYTNAPVVLGERFEDTDDLGGLFSGWDEEAGRYRTGSWGYAPGAGEPPELDPSLEHPRCVFQVLRRHFARYTPEVVEAACGVPRERFLRVAESLCRNSGPERTGAFCYAVGWTQHTTGVQTIRAASIIQLLLGNIGRPGGGILALRGHANIQGSTDIPTLYDLLPGYIRQPRQDSGGDLDDFVARNGAEAGAWGSLRSYLVSLLKAWYGEAATPENDFLFGRLPRVDGDHSHYPMLLRMIDGRCKGLVVAGQNPVVGSANATLVRKALRSLDWLVVRDLAEVETATFWYDSPEIEAGEVRPRDIGTEIFLMPAAAHTEKDGTFTNTQRLLQWHHKAVEPPGDCRSEAWFAFHLGRRLRERIAGSEEPRDRLLRALTWNYPTEGPQDEPAAEAVLAEINGRHADGRPVAGSPELRDDGSTACGSWIHAGVYAGGVNRTARRRPHSEQNWIAPEWGWAWPANRRILYNRASARPDGRPWSERKRYVWWDAEREIWASLGDEPDFVLDRPPAYEPPAGAAGLDAIGGRDPFIVQPDGLGRLYVPDGLVDGPLPAHYEPHESPLPNPLYDVDASPTRQRLRDDANPYHPSGDAEGADVFPYVLTTYRLTEHHTAGGMSRTVAYLSELQPEMFVEISPELASERGIEHRGWATIVTARAAIEARVLVTDRLAPLRVGGRTLHQVGLPYHWGRSGLATGDAANELLSQVLDLNTHISEYKAATCDLLPGRRPRGAALTALVRDYRTRAGARPADARGEGPG